LKVKSSGSSNTFGSEFLRPDVWDILLALNC
jgi:hypothetical protein